MILEFDMEKKKKVEHEIGDIVTKDFSEFFIITYDPCEDLEYLLVSTYDSRIVGHFETIEEIAEKYTIFRKKWEYKLVDNLKED